MKSLLIGGVWEAAPATLKIMNPYRGDIVGEVASGTAEQALRATRLAKEYRSELSAFDRSNVLFRTSAYIEQHTDAFVTSICGETGLCVKDARKEVGRATTNLMYCAEEARRIVGEALPLDIVAGHTHRTAVSFRDPVGVVLAITPFNRPLNQVVVKVGPAIAANNKVVLKPSEKTPLTAILFVEALLECGLPPEMINLVTGTPKEVGDALITSKYVDMITFTGSTGVGKHVAQAAGMIRTTLELGDSGALIVMDDAELTAAVTSTASGAFGSGGQSCRGVKRVLVHKKIADDFVSLLKIEALKLKVGDPMDPDTDIGSLIDEQAAATVEERVKKAIEGGGQLVCGGSRRGAQYWPTVIDHVDRHATLVQEETFGPCAPVVRVRDLADAVNCVNDCPFGLQTGLFTRDIENVLEATRSLTVGAVIANGGPQFESPNIPFGGVKQSGLGREGARYAIHEMTTQKLLVL